MKLCTVTVTRFVTPLPEGGSLPAVIEADDDGMYVLKFRGAGQGRKAPVAELVAGKLARAAGLRVPEIGFALLDPELARTEPDLEIQDLIRASAGLNLAPDYLPSAVTFDPLAFAPAATLGSRLVWLDGFVSNVDRTARNSNLMVWCEKLWLILRGDRPCPRRTHMTTPSCGSCRVDRRQHPGLAGPLRPVRRPGSRAGAHDDAPGAFAPGSQRRLIRREFDGGPAGAGLC